MREIELTQGKVALVDDADYERINRHQWYTFRTGRHWYAARQSPTVGGNRHTIYMAREIMVAQSDEWVDHKNNEATLDNRHSNLRICTNSQNQANSKKRAGCSSKHKGVSWNKGTNKWMAYIKVHSKRIYLGLFDDEDDAGRAYSVAAFKHFGEFARTNMIIGDQG